MRNLSLFRKVFAVIEMKQGPFFPFFKSTSIMTVNETMDRLMVGNVCRQGVGEEQ